MDAHTDWLSFTLPTEREPEDAIDLYKLSRELLRKVSERHETYIYNGTGFDRCVSRPPYSMALRRDDNGVTVYGCSGTSTILYEVSGRACHGIRRTQDAREFIAPIGERLSRWDYAVDISTGTSPTEFYNHRSHKNFRTVSLIRSDTGETVYCGSAKSDRFCRVYRYSDPHPRAHLLRVEFVFKRGLAKHAAELFCQSEDESHFLAKLGNTYGWKHRDWQVDNPTDERIAAPSTTQKEEDTVAWMYRQVAPAMRRLVKVGALDMTDFLQFIYGQVDTGQ